MTNRFERAKDALYNAFFNGTLAKGSCSACAVGNIVAAGQGGTILPVVYEPTNQLVKFRCTTLNQYWKALFVTGCENQQLRNELMLISLFQGISDVTFDELAEKLFQETGYTEEELAKVESAFEKNTIIPLVNYYMCSEQEVLEDQYNGLVAVFDVLLKLEGITESDHREKLRTHPKLQSA